MAPGLHTTTEYKSGVGPYNEFGFGVPKFYHKDLELHGSEKHAPSKYPHYLPTWDNEKGQKYYTLH